MYNSSNLGGKVLSLIGCSYPCIKCKILTVSGSGYLLISILADPNFKVINCCGNSNIVFLGLYPGEIYKYVSDGAVNGILLFGTICNGSKYFNDSGNFW